MPHMSQNDKKQVKKDNFFLFSKTKAKKLNILLVRIKKSLTFAAVLKNKKRDKNMKSILIARISLLSVNVVVETSRA